jgi:FkbM family methyltransferase
MIVKDADKPMISYAQNLEDVMLERAFKGQARGFYIDVGAWEPVLHSVTKHFYDKGWHGINVEPIPAYFAKLAEARTSDVNLNIALLDKPSRTRIFAVPGTGLSTFERAHAEAHGRAGFELEEQAVEVTTLAAICEQYATLQPIDFLKIDTEGTEHQVLQGGNWKRFRPRVVIIEATRPLSPDAAFSDSEDFLMQRDYCFAYFDGLNRFYVAEEEPELLKHFAVPPNVFDCFVTYRMAQAERKVTELCAQVEEMEARLRSAMHKADDYDRLCGTPLGRVLRRLI